MDVVKLKRFGIWFYGMAYGVSLMALLTQREWLDSQSVLLSVPIVLVAVFGGFHAASWLFFAVKDAWDHE